MLNLFYNLECVGAVCPSLEPFGGPLNLDWAFRPFQSAFEIQFLFNILLGSVYKKIRLDLYNLTRTHHVFSKHTQMR